MGGKADSMDVRGVREVYVRQSVQRFCSECFVRVDSLAPQPAKPGRGLRTFVIDRLPPIDDVRGNLSGRQIRNVDCVIRTARINCCTRA